MEQTKFTVFYDDGFQTNDECHEFSSDLATFIGQCEAKNWGGEMVAWAPGTRVYEGRPEHILCAESIAAGRVIEKVDGKYVARGVGDYAAENIAQSERNLQAARQAQAKPAEPKRPALTWNAKTAFDAFPGFKVTRDNAEAPGYAGSFPTSDTASHQVTPKFGSSDLA